MTVSQKIASLLSITVGCIGVGFSVPLLIARGTLLPFMTQANINGTVATFAANGNDIFIENINTIVDAKVNTVKAMQAALTQILPTETVSSEAIHGSSTIINNICIASGGRISAEALNAQILVAAAASALILLGVAGLLFGGGKQEVQRTEQNQF